MNSPPRRSYRRHSTARDTRLRPIGYSTWIEASMINWSAAGASLCTLVENVPLGPAILAVSALDGQNDIRLSCEVIWHEEDRVGLKLLGPVGH